MSTTRLSAALKEVGQPIPPTGITRIEKGERRVDVDDLMALAKALRVSPLTLLLPWTDDPDQEVEITAIGNTSACEAWDWARGHQPPTLSETDPVGDLERFPLDSLPPWARPIVHTISIKATKTQREKLAAAGYTWEEDQE